MRNIRLLIFGIISVAFFVGNTLQDVSAEVAFPSKEEVIKKVHTGRIPFIENQGQIMDEGVKYYATVLGGTIYIREDGELVYAFGKLEEDGAASEQIIRESFLGTSIPEVKAEEKAVTKVNYFKGNDPSQWKSNISTYNLINLGEVYKGIEIKLKAWGNNVEKLFYVKPNMNVENIKVKVQGSRKLSVSEAGDLDVETDLGVVKFTKPVAFQEEEGERKFIEVSYLVKGDEYGFKVGDYDRSKELVIDPLMVATYYGGSLDDGFREIYVDSNGNVYVVGRSRGSDFHTSPGAYDRTYNGSAANVKGDGIIAKFTSSLALMACTYLGGGGGDEANDIYVDTSGDVYVAGFTASADFPTTAGAYDTTFNGASDGFVAKLDSSLATLLASTFIGGSSNDDASSIYVNGNDVYITGYVWEASAGFPTTGGAYDTTHNGDYDGYLANFDGTLANLLASTFFGGSGYDLGTDLIVDSTGSIFLTGRTESSNFPTTGGLEYDTTHNGNADAFIIKFHPNLINLLASTFLGGSNYDLGYSVGIDTNNNVYVTGETSSANFPTTAGAYSSNNSGGSDGFISKLDSNLTNLLSSTYLGGSGSDKSYSLAIDSNDNIHIAGETNSTDFPTTYNAYDTSYNGGGDIFVSKFDNSLQSLLTSTFLGGSGLDVYDSSLSIATDNKFHIYVGTFNESTDFPTASYYAYDPVANGGRDAVIAKFGELIAHWKFDEGIGPMAADSSGNANNGTLSAPTWTTGKSGNALNFDGIDDYVGVSDSPSLDLTDKITLTAWIYPTAIKTQQIIRKGTEVYAPYSLSLSATNDFVFSLNIDGEWLQARQSGYLINRWTHLAGTFDGTTMKLYVDGILEDSLTVPSTAVTLNTTANSLRIGSRLGLPADTFSGVIDEVKIYNYALTAAMIQAEGLFSTVIINDNDTYTGSQNVTLTLSCTGSPVEMMVSENSDLSGASWVAYSTTSAFTLSANDATKTVYAK
ncbi:MAG: SBBP repeat-containing protein, partial [Candidatus Omnitrophica bacterium]|nr:SBBP repeat-containing protein [Candidatus Omnitrophota bacterium]